MQCIALLNITFAHCAFLSFPIVTGSRPNGPENAGFPSARIRRMHHLYGACRNLGLIVNCQYSQ